MATPQQKAIGNKTKEDAARQWSTTDTAPFIQIQSLHKDFDGVAAVKDVSLDIYKGELFAILGASGCGKTTLLRMLAGFETPTSGHIIIDGADMTGIPPYARPLNMMFQSYAVFPHMSVAENVAYGLKKDGMAKADIEERVTAMLELVELGAFAKRKPRQLSGGQRQRVALARALVKRPKVLLLDEPLAALDKKLREQTQFELMNIQYELGITFIVVTHDQEEAMTLATRIAVMDAGKVVQIGTPKEIYEFPRNRFVADFFGTINLFDGVITSRDDAEIHVDCQDIGVNVRAFTSDAVEPGNSVTIGVRPEKISLAREAPADKDLTILSGIVWDLAYYGNLSVYLVKTGSGRIIQVSSQNQQRTAQRAIDWDDEVFLSWDRNSSVVLTT